MPVQAMVPRRNTDGRAEQAQGVEFGDERFHFVLGHVEDHELLVRRGAQPLGAAGLQRVGELHQLAAGEPAGQRGGADEEPAVLLLVHADVVARGGGLGRGRAVVEFVAEVFVLEDLAELHRTPVGQQELQPGLGAHAPVAVVAEDAGDAEPDVGGLVRADEGAEPLAQHGVRGERAAHPEVVADAELGVDQAHQGDVVDLVDHVLAGVAGDGGLEFARQVGQLRVADEAFGELVDQRRGVDDLVLGDAGDRGAQDDAGDVAAGFRGGQVHRLEPAPDFRHVLHPDPVQLDVLAVGEVRRVAGEVDGDLADDAQLLGGEGAAVDADAQHEVLVFQLVRLERGGLAAVDPGLALGVETPPAEAAVQVGAVDRVEAMLRVDGLDTLADVEAVVLLFPGFVGVQRGGAVHFPLPVRLCGGAGGGAFGAACGSLFRGRSG